MQFQYNDGGRAAAGYRGEANDCTCRAIAIALQHPYQSVYDVLNQYAAVQRITKRKKRKGSARSGVYRSTIHQVMEGYYGWRWVPTMFIGSGCKVHLKAEELPPGRLVVSVSKHMVAVIDGVIHDTYDCSRDGTRCVYGYFIEA